jgi:hypothetical protein
MASSTNPGRHELTGVFMFPMSKGSTVHVRSLNYRWKRSTDELSNYFEGLTFGQFCFLFS